MAHRQPGTVTWDLAEQSKRLWEQRCSAGDGAALIEWQVRRGWFLTSCLRFSAAWRMSTRNGWAAWLRQRTAGFAGQAQEVTASAGTAVRPWHALSCEALCD